MFGGWQLLDPYKKLLEILEVNNSSTLSGLQRRVFNIVKYAFNLPLRSCLSMLASKTRIEFLHSIYILYFAKKSFQFSEGSYQASRINNVTKISDREGFLLNLRKIMKYSREFPI